MKLSTLCHTILLAILAAPALGQTAGMLSFQGLIKDGAGDLIDGAVDLDFRIYDAQMGGNHVDMDGDGSVDDVCGQDVTCVSTTATDGIVSVKWGPVSPTAFDGTDRWLQVSVDGSPLSRVEVVTAPASSEQVNIPATGNPAIRVDASGNVGIGVAPTSKLCVAGTIESTSGGIKFPDATVQTTAAADSLWTESAGDISYTAGSVGIATTGPFLTGAPSLSVVASVLPTPRQLLSCAPHSASGKIYCFGGSDGTRLGSVGKLIDLSFLGRCDDGTT